MTFGPRVAPRRFILSQASSISATEIPISTEIIDATSTPNLEHCITVGAVDAVIDAVPVRAWEEAVAPNPATAVKTRDTKLYYTHHLAFHEIFIERSGNELIRELLKTIRMQSLWHRFSYQYYLEDLPKSYRVHQRILKLFETKTTPPEKLRAVIEDHINTALDRFLSYLEEFERT